MNIQDKINHITNTYNTDYQDHVLVETKNINGAIEKEKRRFFISSHAGLCVYAHGARRRGYKYEPSPSVIDLEVMKKTGSKKTEAEIWASSWIRALQMLNESGLWDEIKRDIEIALSIGYEKMRAAYKASDTWDKDISYQDLQKKRIEAVRAIDSRLVDDTGYNTTLLWHMSSSAKIKKMNFGKYYNEHVFSQIKKALTDEKEYNSGRYQVSYDVSFSYNPELKKAWYSEEFRDCGNGHYYLALSATHAIYWESD